MFDRIALAVSTAVSHSICLRAMLLAASALAVAVIVVVTSLGGIVCLAWMKLKATPMTHEYWSLGWDTEVYMHTSSALLCIITVHACVYARMCALPYA